MRDFIAVSKNECMDQIHTLSWAWIRCISNWSIGNWNDGKWAMSFISVDLESLVLLIPSCIINGISGTPLSEWMIGNLNFPCTKLCISIHDPSWSSFRTEFGIGLSVSALPCSKYGEQGDERGSEYVSFLSFSV